MIYVVWQEILLWDNILKIAWVPFLELGSYFLKSWIVLSMFPVHVLKNLEMVVNILKLNIFLIKLNKDIIIIRTNKKLTNSNI